MSTSKRAEAAKGQKTDDFQNEINEPLEVNQDTLDGLMPDDLNNDKLFSAVFDTIENKDKTELNQVEAMEGEYLSLSSMAIDEERSFIFTGIKEISVKKKDGSGQVDKMDAVVLVDRERNVFVSSSKVVVGKLSKVEKIPCPVKIVYKGKVKSANGTYDSVEIYTL